MMAIQVAQRSSSMFSSSILSRQMRRLLAVSSVTLFALMILTAYLSPFAYMSVTALKDRAQFSEARGPLWPADAATYTYEGQEYPIYKVPTEQGLREWALVQKRREQSWFVDPSQPEAGLLEWTGKWRTLDRVWVFSPHLENFPAVWSLVNIGRLLRNTFVIATLSSIGILLSSAVVAYGFARFHFPGRNIIFMILMATIILPRQVVLIPLYALFTRIGWNGTWLPLIVPHFFANAYNVFLLRQFFMTIPLELDEAAIVDGAGPFRILISIILPQAVPALTAVGLFHFFWSWNEFFEPLIYLSAKPELQPISVGLGILNALYARETHLLQAASLIGLLPPVIVFFLAQRVFMQGVVITGVEK